MKETLISSDRKLFLLLNTLGSEPFDRFFILVSAPWFWIPVYIILAYLLYKKYSLRNFLFILLFFGIGITASDQLAGIYKNGIMRLRPCHDASLIPLMRMVKCGGNYGFYSAHASNFFFVATYFSHFLKGRYKLLAPLLFLWAALIAFSRIYLGVHFPLDVLFGVAAGFLLGGTFASLAEKVVQKKP